MQITIFKITVIRSCLGFDHCFFESNIPTDYDEKRNVSFRLPLVRGTAEKFCEKNFPGVSYVIEDW